MLIKINILTKRVLIAMRPLFPRRGVKELATVIAVTKSSDQGAQEGSLTMAEQTISELAPAIVRVKSIIADALNTVRNIGKLNTLCCVQTVKSTPPSSGLEKIRGYLNCLAHTFFFF